MFDSLHFFHIISTGIITILYFCFSLSDFIVASTMEGCASQIVFWIQSKIVTSKCSAYLEIHIN